MGVILFWDLGTVMITRRCIWNGNGHLLKGNLSVLNAVMILACFFFLWNAISNIQRSFLLDVQYLLSHLVHAALPCNRNYSFQGSRKRSPFPCQTVPAASCTYPLTKITVTTPCSQYIYSDRCRVRNQPASRHVRPGRPLSRYREEELWGDGAHQ